MNDDRHEGLFRLAMEAGAARNYPRAVGLLLQITSETDRYPQAFLFLGRAYHALREYENAIRYLSYFVEISPDEGAGHFFLGRTYLAYDLPKLAVLQLKHAVGMSGENGQARALLGLAYLKLKRSDLAVVVLGEALSLSPASQAIQVGYLNALLVDAIRRFRAGDLSLARQMFEFLVQAGREDPLPHLYLAAIEKNAKNYSSALHHYDQALSYAPGDTIVHLQRADMLLRIGRLQDAVRSLRALGLEQEPVAEEPDPVGLARELAIQSYQRGQYRKAVSFAHRVLRHGGPDLDMHLLMGEAYRELGSLDKALNHFQRAIDLAPEALEPRYGLALTQWLRSEWKQMLSTLRRILRIDPRNPTGAYYVPLCMCRLGLPHEETIPALEQQIRVTEGDAFLEAALGEQYLRVPDPARAAAAFRRAVKADGAQPVALSGLIQAYRLLGESAKTEAAYKDYLAKFPEDKEQRRSYIQLLLDKGKYALAEDEILAAMAASSEPEVERLLAFCQRKSGKYNEAAVIYRRLLQADPKNEDLLRSLCFCLEKAENRQGAIDLLEGAFDFLSPSSTMRLILGVLYEKGNDLEKALGQFRAVLSKNPKEWRALRNMGLIYRRMGVRDFADRYLATADKHMPRRGPDDSSSGT